MKIERIERKKFEEMDLPETVYKYRNWDKANNRTIITERKVYFAPPDTFDDKDDCKIPVRWDLLTDKEIFQIYYNDSRENNPSFTREQHRQFAREWTEKSPLKNKEYLKQRMQIDHKDFNKSFGVLSLTSKSTNFDLWINYSDKMTQADALAGASSCTTGGYNDWRLPTIKEQYSLMMYYGAEANPTATSQGTAIPFIDTNYFTFGYGDINSSAHGATSNERLIDAQYATSTIYVSTTMDGNATMFGVNFADGRIKGYPANNTKKYYVLYVRGNAAYGTNNFVNNGDGTISDNSTGLTWMQNDNATPILWENALSYAENFTYAGYSDWRLPDVKELQSIVDYTRSPATTNSAAINPVFNCTQITNEAGIADYPYYMSSTTFSSQTPTDGTHACYVSFGRAMGYMSAYEGWVDVHGAGAQRADPKTGNPADYPTGFGPQGDAIRIYNYVRLVRTATTNTGLNEINSTPQIYFYPNPVSDVCNITMNKEYKTIVIDIYNTVGSKIRKLNFVNSKSINICLADMPQGLYIMHISLDGISTTSKFIKD